MIEALYYVLNIVRLWELYPINDSNKQPDCTNSDTYRHLGTRN